MATVIMATLPGDLTAVVTRPPAKDRMGDLTGDPVTHTVDGCLLAPGATAEDHARAERTTSDWDLYAPESADILATDKVAIPELGVLAQVNGDPRVWPGAGLVVPLRRVRG